MARKMKDSGVEWIGMIPDGWTLGRIGELYSERNQKVNDVDYPPLSVTMQGVLPQLANVAKTDAHDDRKLVRCGDFAINSRSDRRGSCGIADRDGSVSLINTVLCPRNEMNPRYYNWLFHTTMFADEFYKWGHGIVDDLWTTRWADMKQMSVPCPSLPEQKSIAEHLDAKCFAIDDVIAKTSESIDEYKKLKQAVITEAVTKGVRGKRPMKDSGIDWIGQIPKEWTCRRVKHLCSKVADGTHFSPETVSSGYPYITAKDVDGLGLDYESACKVSELDFESMKKAGCSPEKDDVLIVKDGATTGRTGVVVDDTPCVLLSSVAMMHTNEDVYNIFFWYMLQSTLMQEQIKIAMAGSAMPRITLKKLVEFWGVHCSLDEQREIADYLDSKCAAIDTLISKKQQFIEELTAYKKSLIYEYVTGKKEVPA